MAPWQDDIVIDDEKDRKLKNDFPAIRDLRIETSLGTPTAL